MAVSTVGTWLQIVAQDWLVLDITGGSGSALGIATALQFIALLVLGMWGGVVADRYPKRRILMATQTTQGVLALVLGTLTIIGVVRLWHVYALALALGLVNVIDLPTRQALVVELVRPADRANAVALDGATTAGTRLIGPAVAGLLINVIGVGPVFLVNGLSFGVPILALALIRKDELYVAPRAKELKGQVRAALSYMRGRRDLVLVLVLVGFVAAFGMSQQVTIPLMTRNVFHTGAGAYGVASSAFAVGAFVGSLLAARIGHPSKRLILIMAFLFGVVEAASALPPTYGSFLALMPPTALLLVMIMTPAVVIIQLDVAPEMRGRISGLYFLVSIGTRPIGAPVIGWVSQAFGARIGLVVSGLVTALAAMAVASLLLRTSRMAAPAMVRDSPPTPASVDRA